MPKMRQAKEVAHAISSTPLRACPVTPHSTHADTARNGQAQIIPKAVSGQPYQPLCHPYFARCVSLLGAPWLTSLGVRSSTRPSSWCCATARSQPFVPFAQSAGAERLGQIRILRLCLRSRCGRFSCWFNRQGTRNEMTRKNTSTSLWFPLFGSPQRASLPHSLLSAPKPGSPAIPGRARREPRMPRSR